MTSPTPIRAAWARLATALCNALRALMPVPAPRPAPVPVHAPRHTHTAGTR